MLTTRSTTAVVERARGGAIKPRYNAAGWQGDKYLEVRVASGELPFTAPGAARARE